MTAVWFQFRIAFRNRWKAWTAMGLLAGAAAGVVMVAVAGARRTDSSLHRVVVDGRAADVLVNPNNGALTDAQWRRIEQLPQVAHFARSVSAPMVPIEPDGRPDFSSFESVHSPLVFENPDGFEFHDIDLPGVVAGRLPAAGEADALVINETAAATQHLRVGSKLRVGFFDEKQARSSDASSPPKVQDEITLTVAAIVRPLDDATRAPDDPRLAPTFVLSAALSRRIAALGSPFGGLSVRLRDPGRLAEFERQVRTIAGGDVIDFQELSGTLQRARRAIRPYVLALWLFAALALFAGVAVVVQIATRQQRYEALPRPVLRALGITRGDLGRVAALRGMFIGAVAAAAAAIVTVAASPRMPIGPLRALEPRRGVDIDVTVLVVGVLALVVLLCAHGVLVAIRRPVHAAAPRHRPADALASRGASPAVVTGVRFALDPGRGDAALPVRSTALGVGIAIGALIATLVFAAGLTHFTSTPQMYGWVWSYQIEPGGFVTPATLEQAVATLARDPRVRGAAVGAYAQLTIDGKTVGAVAVQTGHGVPIVETVSGREPERPGDIVLGSETLRSMHRRVGDGLEVDIGGVTRPFTVVGRAVFPRFAPYSASEPTGLGAGAAMTLDGLARFGPLDGSGRSPLAAGPFALVDAAPGTSASVIRRLAFHGDPNAGLVLSAQRPNYVDSYQHLERTPLALAGLLVVLAIATTIHLLVSVVRRRRHDLAVLRALGFTAAQLRTSVLVQATTIVGLTLAVAIPIGVLAGRLLWRVTADWLGIPVHGIVPVASVALVALVALAIANGVAMVPALAAARVDPAEILRRE